MARLMFQVIAVLLVTNAGVRGDTSDDYWPTWRGPDCMGISPKGNPPLIWSELKNIKWKVKLTGDGSNSSPVIWGNKIFFQTAAKTEVRREPIPIGESGDAKPEYPPPSNAYKFNVVCLDRESGKLLWQKTVREELPHQGHHTDHGFASFSPVTDGKLVWASFGSHGLYCYDTDGNLKWSKDLGKMDIGNSYGEGGSPALAGDAVIVVMDHEGDSFIAVFEKETGEIIWKKDRDEDTSWATPLPIEVKGRMQVVTSSANFVRSYDLETGQMIWKCKGQAVSVIPSPVAGMGMVFCAGGSRGPSLQAIELGHTGDLTDTDAVKWHVAKVTPYVPSPLLYGNKFYFCYVNEGVISCYNAETGKAHFFKQRLEQIDELYASPVGIAGRVYLVGRNGVTYILKLSEKIEVLAVNKLDDRFDCSPAFVGNEIYLKGKENLYCIASSR
ncbi:MAG: PQQ-binding-like beta-propeller repeat protein [Phycisphaerae bacterium]|nr:PQQ-binding-like beta-propeller repeat protein [Phycisphaerae bacterium]